MKFRFSSAVRLFFTLAKLFVAGTFAMPGRNISIGLRWKQ